ncbi:MAG: 2-O-(6-phospho-alpha-D-mannosyl)-D-glycerate hydrolase [Acidimicrobiaceae bacterium]
MTPRTVAVVPHTHWDREWYAPYQTFRLRLVDLLDDLLPRLDADPSYAHFMLDGQMAVIDDYLQVRPEAEPTIRRLVASGRLSVGPWYILMDEFLVSGETIVRDLQLGIERAAAFGGAMAVGYLPDMFGHIAQMPQLLQQFGFADAVVWRGVPATIDRSAFWWSSPDGSTVRAEYLPQGYGNGAVTPDDAKKLLERLREFSETWGDLLHGPILWMNGTDHQAPQPWLGRVVGEVNDLQDDYQMQVMSLPAYLAQAARDDLPAWTGELRSGARANLLMGVASNRVDVKQAAARAERALEQEAEPLSALYQPPARWPAALLAEAWREVVRNAAHDSICACSVDEVCDAVLHRFAEARQIGEGLADRAIGALGASIEGSGTILVNPSPRARSGLVVVDVGDDDEHPGAQVLKRRGREQVLGEMERSTADVILKEVQNNLPVDGIIVDPVEGDPDRVVVRVTRQPSQRLLVRAVDVPGYGWRAWDPAGTDALRVEPAVVSTDGRAITNGLVELAIADDGTYAIDGQTGFGRIVHEGDVGDTYNWCPPNDDVPIAAPTSVSVDVVERGPLRGRVQIRSTYRWPKPTEVITTLELQAGERLVRFTVAWDNQCRDHRVRAWFPLPSPAATSRAECAFAIVERGLTAEGGPSEVGLPTFPSRRFVQAGGLTLVHEGLLEYELVDVHDDRAGSIALTLARCTGMLSQVPMATRPLPAGPFTRMEGSQMQGPVEVRGALYVGDDVDPYALVDDALVPLRITQARGGDRPSEGQALTVDGAQVSALRRVGGRLELRVFNPSATETTVTIADRTGWLIDLRGRALEPFTGSFVLAPWKIATARLDD